MRSPTIEIDYTYFFEWADAVKKMSDSELVHMLESIHLEPINHSENAIDRMCRECVEAEAEERGLIY